MQMENKLLSCKAAETLQEQEDFLSLPENLYAKKYCTQNKETEQDLLLGKHTLSKYFRFYPYIAYVGEKAVGRITLTIYPSKEGEPPTAYTGFFECIDDSEMAKLLFETAHMQAKAQGCKTVQGPVNASFWISYRLKTNLFDEAPYFGEPYHHSYYRELWEENGYNMAIRYVSNRFPKLKKVNYNNPKFQQRLQDFREQGYTIRSLKPEEWDETIRDLYRMIMRLYSDFPVFHALEEEDFIALYNPLKQVIDFSIIMLVFYEDKPVAFMLSIPDYGTLLSRKITPIAMLKLLWKRKHNSQYVLLYMGVEPEHQGLGKAVTQAVIERLHELEVSSIGSFVQEGKVNEKYASDIMEEQYEYMLFEKQLDSMED